MAAINFAASDPIFMLCGKTCPKSIHIIGKVSHTNFHRCSCQANGSHNQIPCLLSLYTENMLNPATNPRLGPVTLLLKDSQLSLPSSFSMNTLSVARPLQVLARVIRRVCPNVAVRILRQDLLKHVGIMDRGFSHLPTTDQFMFSINGDMIFVAKKGLAIFLGPTGINIFSSSFVFAPLHWCPAFILYLLIFFTAITLYRSLNNRGIHYLSFQRRIATFLQVQLKLRKQFFNYASGFQVLTKKLYSGRIRNLASYVQAEKTTKRMAVKNLVFGGIIGKVIQRA